MSADRFRPTASLAPGSQEAAELKRALLSTRSKWLAPHYEASRRYLGLTSGSNIASTKTTERFAANLVGIGIAEKRSDGKFCGEPAVTFFVRQKFGVSQLQKVKRIPRTICGYATDVVRVGKQQITQGHRVDAGGRVNVAARSPGSIGGILRDGSGAHFAITCGHVVGNGVGSPAFSPPQGMLGSIQIGHVSQSLPPRAGVFNDVDVALISIPSQVHISPALPVVGQPTAPAKPDPQQIVRMFGGYSQGTTGWLYATHVNYLLPVAGATFGFREVFMFRKQGTGAFGQQGDSGSLILDDNTQAAVALFFSVASGFGFGIPMAKIVSALPGLDFV